ncbi:MAG TPA: hypothetical protein VH165_19770 [Kofleriaceae bacterium]|nr:hypothetical protein [Kofleriaceae bacterium]
MVILAECCARCAEVPSPREAEALAHRLARECHLAAGDAAALVAAARHYAQTVGPELLVEESRAQQAMMIESLLDMRVRPVAPDVSRRLLPPQWRDPELPRPRHAARGERTAARFKKHRILFLAANVYEVDPIAFCEEYAAIHTQLRATPRDVEFEIAPFIGFQLEALQHHLLAYDPEVIHVSGRSGVDSSLVFEDARRRPAPISARALVALIRDVAPNVRLIVLSGCYRHVEADRLRAEIECVVGMDGAVTDADARGFLCELYGGLGEGLSVGEAMAHGMAAMALTGRPAPAGPHYLTRDDVDVDQISFRPTEGTPGAFHMMR